MFSLFKKKKKQQSKISFIDICLSSYIINKTNKSLQNKLES